MEMWLVFIWYVQVAAPGERPVKAAAGPGQRTVGQQQSVWSGQNSGRDLSHLRETGEVEHRVDHIDHAIVLYVYSLGFVMHKFYAPSHLLCPSAQCVCVCVYIYVSVFFGCAEY